MSNDSNNDSPDPIGPLKATSLPKLVEGRAALTEGRFADAELIFRELAAHIRRLYGGENIQMAIALDALSSALRAQGKNAEAIEYAEQASRILLRQKN